MKRENDLLQHRAPNSADAIALKVGLGLPRIDSQKASDRTVLAMPYIEDYKNPSDDDMSFISSPLTVHYNVQCRTCLCMSAECKAAGNF
jgi:hypothetical protein